jgi:hypothetical protein
MPSLQVAGDARLLVLLQVLRAWLFLPGLLEVASGNGRGVNAYKRPPRMALMGYLLIDILDHDDRELADKPALFGLNNWLNLYAKNALEIPQKVRASIVDDLTSSEGATRAKIRIESEAAFTEPQVHALAKYAVWYILFWRHGLPVTPYVVETEPNLAP